MNNPNPVAALSELPRLVRDIKRPEDARELARCFRDWADVAEAHADCLETVPPKPPMVLYQRDDHWEWALVGDGLHASPPVIFKWFTIDVGHSDHAAIKLIQDAQI